MKKFKIVLNVFLILGVMMMFSSFSVLAKSSSEIEFDSMREEELVQELKKLDKNQDINKWTEKFLKENKFSNKEVVKNKSPFPGIEIEELSNMKELDFNEYLEENILNGNFRLVEINENAEIIFTDEDMFILSTTKIEQNSYDLQTNSLFSISALTQYTGTVSRLYVAYSWVGLPLWEIYAEGEFSYNGSIVTPYFYDGYVKKRFTGFIWQIDNYSEGVTSAADNSWATVYTRANFHYGIEYDGIGWVWQYIDVKNQIKCDKNGNISKTMIFRD